MSNPTVSICCITYNQEKFLRKTLDSFIMQETDFSYEVLINDDKSTDNTPKIIKEYVKKYPDIIKPVFNKKNLGAVKNFFTNFERSTGKFVAICEGDDYWTDPKKLQKQVDFLKKNQKYSICFHSVKVHHDGIKKEDYIFPRKRFNLTVNELLKRNFIQTNSVMYRRQKKYNLSTADFLPGDWYLHIYHAKFGEIGFIDEVMSVYNRHVDGIWSDTMNNKKKFWTNTADLYMTFFTEVLKLFPNDKEKQNIIKTIASNKFKNIIVYLGYENETVLNICRNFPEFVMQYIKRLRLKEVKITKSHKSQELNNKKQLSKISQKNQSISEIVNSNSYKIGVFVTKPLVFLRKIINSNKEKK